jgi:hypothetical protein
MQIYQARLGYDILEECRQLVALAVVDGPHEMDFNGITIKADRDSDAAALAQFYRDEMDRQHQEYLASDLYKQRQAEAAAEEVRRSERFKAAMDDVEARGVASLTLSDPEAWQKTAAANPDGYGSAIMRYAETWGRLMEARVLAGQTIAECAEETSRIADTEGITGFQYGSAAQMLCQWWIHGVALKAWRVSKGICY